MELVAKHRMREIKMWSKLKGEFNDGSFNDKDVNQHQLESYGMQYHEKAKTLNANSSESEIFNVMGQLQSLQRIKKSGELENSYKEKEKLEQLRAYSLNMRIKIEEAMLIPGPDVDTPDDLDLVQSILKND